MERSTKILLTVRKLKCKRKMIIHVQPGSVVDKHLGLWSRGRRFESAPGYFYIKLFVFLLVFCKII